MLQGSGAAQVAGQRTKQQLIFVVDATYALQDYLDKTAGFRAWITELVQIFDAKHRDKEYTLILYRGYPYGSDCAVECSDKTSDYKCFLHWFESIHYEGGGSRKHALADGLNHCLNCIVQGSENYIVVLTASEASEICTINPQVNLQIILSKLVLTCKVSLICVRKIHQLIKLWTEDVQQANMAPTQTSIPGVNAFLLGFEKKAQNHQVWAGKFAWKEQGQVFIQFLWIFKVIFKKKKKKKICFPSFLPKKGEKMEWE